MPFEVVDPVAVLRTELAAGASQKSISITYAIIYRQIAAAADWGAINKAIERRWDAAGLERVKEMAWKFMGEDK